MDLWKATLSIGRYQWVLLSVISLYTVTFWANFGIVLFAPGLPFTCLELDGDSTSNQCEGRNSSFDADYSLTRDSGNVSFIANCTYDETSGTCVESPSECTKFQYDHSQFSWTLTERFDLVCGREYIITILKSIWIVGQLFSSITGGILADKIGRKRLVLLSCVVAMVCHLVSGVAGNIWLYVALRALLACCEMYGYIGVLVLLMESLRKEQRLAAMLVDTCADNVSLFVLGIVYFITSNYVHLHIIMIITWAMIMGITIFFAHESPRWLTAKKRDDQAMDIVRKISKLNQVPVEELDHLLLVNEKNEGSFLDLFRTPLIRKRSIVLIIIWITFILSFYSIVYNLGDFTEDVRISFIISGVIELACTIPFALLLDKFGRPVVIFVMMFTGGICCLCMAPIVENKSHPALLGLALTGKLLLRNMFFVMYLYTPELYPTVIRGTGLGACSTSSRIVAILAPQIRLLNRYWPPLMVVTIGTLVVLAAFLAPLLPDMTNVEMPQTIQNGEELFKDHGYSLRRAKVDNDRRNLRRQAKEHVDMSVNLAQGLI